MVFLFFRMFVNDQTDVSLIFVHGQTDVSFGRFQLRSPLLSIIRLESSNQQRTRHQQVHQPGIEPRSHRWQRCILPLDHWCSNDDKNWCRNANMCTLKRKISSGAALASQTPWEAHQCTRSRSNGEMAQSLSPWMNRRILKWYCLFAHTIK